MSDGDDTSDIPARSLRMAACENCGYATTQDMIGCDCPCGGNYVGQNFIPMEVLEKLVEEFEDKHCLYAKSRLKEVVEEYE